MSTESSVSKNVKHTNAASILPPMPGIAILVGAVSAGTIGSLGGVVLAWSVTRFGFEIAWPWSPMAYILAIVLTVVAGFGSSLRALAARPLSVLPRTAG